MILSCGEALIDMLPRTSTLDEAAFAPFPGGSVFNTAVALGRLGAPSQFFSGLSDDFFGNMLRAWLVESNVDDSLARISHRPSTLAFVHLIDGQASYAFYDENTAGRMLSPADLPVLTDSTQALFFGGISLVVEPCAGAYEVLLLREAPNKTVMIDPNIRTSFITNEAAYRLRLDRILAASDIVKLSDEDLHWLRGGGDITECAQKIVDMGPKIVCITEGAKGVTAYTAEGATFVAANRVEVADTVGAGDTFNAGFLAGLHRVGALDKATVANLPRDILVDALTLGTRAAAVTVSRAGANSPWSHELD